MRYHKKYIITNNDDTISLSIKEVESADVLILQEKDVMNITLSYDQMISINILIPRQCSVNHLLRNQIYLNQLNLKTLSSDYILTLVSSESRNRPLTNNEMNKTIECF